MSGIWRSSKPTFTSNLLPVVVNGTCGSSEARILIRQPEYTANINEPINDNAKNKIEKDVFVDGLLSSASIEKLVTSLKKYQDYFGRNQIEFYEIVEM